MPGSPQPPRHGAAAASEPVLGNWWHEPRILSTVCEERVIRPLTYCEQKKLARDLRLLPFCIFRFPQALRRMGSGSGKTSHPFVRPPPEPILSSRPAGSQGRRAQGQSRMAVTQVTQQAQRFQATP